MPYKRDKCKQCKRRSKEAGYISARGLCHSCGMARMEDQNEMTRRGMRQVQHGRQRLAAAVRRNGDTNGGR